MNIITIFGSKHIYKVQGNPCFNRGESLVLKQEGSRLNRQSKGYKLAKDMEKEK